MSTSWSKTDHAAMDVNPRNRLNGSTVHIEIANEVNCVVCGEKRYSMTSPYVCHDCWKDAKVGEFIADLQGEITSLRETSALKDQEIAAYQDRIENLQDFVKKFLDNWEDCDNCGGNGVDTETHEMCRRCHGEGHTIVSVGVLYSELFHEGISLVSGEAQ